MSNNLRSSIELGTQILIAVAVVVAAGVLVKRNFFPHHQVLTTGREFKREKN